MTRPAADPNEPGPGEKLCPYCAEVIRAAAIKCRYCGSDLPAPVQAMPDVTPDPATETAGSDDVAPADVASDPVAPDEVASADVAPDEAVEAPPEPAEAAETPEAPAEPEPMPETEPMAAAESEPESESESETAAGAPRLLLTAGLILALCIAAAGLWAVARSADHSDVAANGQLADPGARAAIMAQAVRLTTTVMSYDASHSASDIAAAEKLMTPHARQQYEASLPAAKDRARQAQLHITVDARIASLTGTNPTKGQPSQCVGQDCAVSLISATKSTASVLLFVDQSAAAKGGKNTVLSPTWELVGLVKQNGTWLIDDLQSSS